MGTNGFYPKRRVELDSRLRRNARRHRQQRYRTLPWWRKPLMGYLLTLPFVVLVMLMSWLLLQMRVPNDFLATPAFLVTVLIAWIWGAGPAIVASVLGILALDFFFLQGENMTFELRETLPLFPFLFAQLVVAVIIAQRESARQQALFAQQELQERTTKTKPHHFSSHPTCALLRVTTRTEAPTAS